MGQRYGAPPHAALRRQPQLQAERRALLPSRAGGDEALGATRATSAPGAAKKPKSARCMQMIPRAECKGALKGERAEPLGRES